MMNLLLIMALSMRTIEAVDVSGTNTSARHLFMNQLNIINALYSVELTYSK